MDEHKTALIELEAELQVIRNKPAFIKRAVPQEALMLKLRNDKPTAYGMALGKLPDQYGAI
jgi:hypothetical protein